MACIQDLLRITLNGQGSSIIQNMTNMLIGSAVIEREISPNEVFRDPLKPMRIPPGDCSDDNWYPI